MFLYSVFNFLVMMYLPASTNVAGNVYCSQAPRKAPVMDAMKRIFVVANAMARGGKTANVGKRRYSTTSGNGLSPIQRLTIMRANAFKFSLRVIETIGKAVPKVNTG